MRMVALLVCMSVVTASCDAQVQSSEESPYLFLFAGDQDMADSDFLAVIDLRPDSSDFGMAIATTPIGMKASMPHHMEYEMPPDGELLFMNAHHHEISMLVDVSDPRAPRVAKTLNSPSQPKSRVAIRHRQCIRQSRRGSPA